MTKVKICGVRTLEAAAAAKHADLVGLNFVPTSKRAIDLQTARALRPHLGHAEIAGVFQDQPLELIEALAKDLDYVQLHGREPPDFCAAIKTPIIKAITVTAAVDLEALDAYAPHVAMFLFDGKTAGSGQTFAWDLLKSVAIPRPYLIAGGLTPENVRVPIAALHPWGVDTASGVETLGRQDPERIAKFIEEARRA